MQQFATLIYLVVIFGVFYLFIIRPQQQKAKEHNELVAALSTGDRVVTAGGIYGVIRAIENDTVSLEVSPDVVLKIAKNAVAMRDEGVKASS